MVNNSENNKESAKGVNRRTFLHSTAVAGAGLVLSPMVGAQTSNGKTDDVVNVALIGAGAQGQTLLDACINRNNIPNVRFKAVCDIWDYNREYVSRKLNAYKKRGHEGTAYVDYREMLDKEKDLDAVIVATPDFWHAEHTVACLEAGLHVYCEKEMSNTLAGAKRMVEAARRTGKLLQIGHQRRSNPRYIYCYEKLIKDAKILGHITTINGQWNRRKAACEDFGWPDGEGIDQATLEKYGFNSMEQFRNWRWYKGLGGGPVIDLGSHQIDIYSWFLDAFPKSVTASGGIDYWKDHQWYDNVMAIYEFETEQGTVRAFYQTLTTNSSGGYFESFMGDEGTLVISEASGRGSCYREQGSESNSTDESEKKEDPWGKWIKNGYLWRECQLKGHLDCIDGHKKEYEQGLAECMEDCGCKPNPAKGAVLDVRESVPAEMYELPIRMDKAYHQPHLENFFDAVCGKAKLNCPAEIGYETAVMVLKVNEAVEAGRRLDFKPEEFKV